MAAELCPVCKGSGRKIDTDGCVPGEKICHGCNGKGWVETGSAPVPYVPPHLDQPYLYSHPYYPWIVSW